MNSTNSINPMNSYRGGMQVHAVPDDERATDSRGQKLPWGYSYPDASVNRKHPVEKGPFGKTANRRSMSRSKTATPATRDDIQRIENNKFLDDIFSIARAEEEERRTQSGARDQPQLKSTLSRANTSFDLTSSSATLPQQSVTAGASISPSKSTQRVSASLAEPTEVMLYGYALDHQYAAINYYEAASNGHIYEDYDRQPPNPRFQFSSQRRIIPRNLSQSALRKINQYQGGDHWIKVTFDSPESAEAACHASPHIINGYEVHAELWRGAPPPADVAIAPGTTAGSLAAGRRPINQQQSSNFRTMPGRMQSTPNLFGRNASLQDSPQSSISSATEGGTASTLSTATTITGSDPPSFGLTSRRAASVPAAIDEEPVSRLPVQKPMRIAGATRAQLLPASTALLPVPPWSQRTFGHLPLIGQLFGGPSKGTVIGVQIPRKENGEFDWDRASMWWRVCFVLDSWFGTDFCGLKID